MYAWQELNGLPRDKVIVVRGSITVELVDGEMMLFCSVIPLQADGKPYLEPDPASREPMIRSVVMPYKEPIPEGIGKLVDWTLTVPQRETAQRDDAA